jgi:hypothetical protein
MDKHLIQLSGVLESRSSGVKTSVRLLRTPVNIQGIRLLSALGFAASLAKNSRTTGLLNYKGKYIVRNLRI